MHGVHFCRPQDPLKRANGVPLALMKPLIDAIQKLGRIGFTRIGEEERRDGEAIALHKTHIWANSLKPVCFLCFLLFWCPLLPFIETGTLKIYTKMVLYMKNEFFFFDLKYPPWGLNPHCTNLRVVFFL